MSFGQINFEQSLSVNEAGADPHASAILDLASSEKGLLIPRMTTSQRTAITGTEGLMVYDTTTDSFWYHDGALWNNVGASASAFENLNGVVRSTGDNSTDDFVFGANELPTGEVSDKFFFYDKGQSAFRGGELFQSRNWIPDSLGENSFAYGFNTLADGYGSMALGAGVEASGSLSMAFGASSKSTGSSSISLGTNNVASGQNSIAIGTGIYSTKRHSLVVGSYNVFEPCECFGPSIDNALFLVGNGTSFGNRSNAFAVNQNGSIIGSGPSLTYLFSTPSESGGPFSRNSDKISHDKMSSSDTLALFGFNAFFGSPTDPIYKGSLSSGLIDITSGVRLSSGVASFSSGLNAIAAGYASSALGHQVVSTSYSGLVIGMFNDYQELPIETSPTSDTPLFTIGNGDDEQSRSNAMVVRKDGLVEIGTTRLRDTFDFSKNEAIFRMGANVTPDLDNVYNSGGSNFRWKKVFSATGTIQTSDIRAKKNINSLPYGLNEVMSLRPVSYDWKDNIEKGHKSLGLIAQELLDVIPEVVNVPEDDNDLLGVNYAELIPVLINAIQEQQEVIESLQIELFTQGQKIEMLVD